MNLREISGLTRHLSELLDKGLHKAREPKLAGNYEGACKDANNRLIQCSRMLEEGNMPGAVQLANVNPPLMELIRALTWEDAGIWREYCNSNKLPSPPAFDGPAIKTLTQALVNEDVIGPEHPLSKEFSSLMMKKHQEEAYRVLCVILEKDPSNQSYISIKPQLEQYIIEQKTGQLAQFTSRNDTARTLVLMREIEDFPFARLQEIDIWPQAKTLECYNWITEIDQCRQANDWKEAQERIQRIDQARTEFPSVQLTPEYEQYINQIRAWVQQEEIKWLTQLNLDEAIRNLEVFLSNRENDRLMHRRVKYVDLLNLQFDLGTLWNDLQSLEQPIPDTLIKRFREEEDALDYDIERASVARKWTYAAATVAGVAICTFLVVCLVNFNSAKALRAKLKQYKKDRDLHAVEAALSDISMLKLKRLIAPGFKQAISEAQTYVAEEKGRLTNVVKQLSELKEIRVEPAFDGIDLSDVASLEAVQAKLVGAAKLVAELPPKDIETNSIELIRFTNSWETFLRPERTKRQARLQEILDLMKANQTNLVLFTGPKTVERGGEAFDGNATEWEEIANVKVPYLQPTKPQIVQYGNYKTSKGVFQGHLDEWNKSNDKLKGASQLNDLTLYMGTLDEIAVNQITSSISKKAITTIKSFNLDQTRIVTDLLAPEIFKKKDNFPDLIGSFSLKAETVNDPDFVTGMSDIINSKAIHQYSLYIVEWKDDGVFRSFDEVYVQKPGELILNNKKPVNMYIPREAQGAIQFSPKIFREIQPKIFPGYKASLNNDDSRRLALSSVIREANLENLWDLKEKKWQGQILDCLDRLKRNMYRDGPYGRIYALRRQADPTKQYPRGNAMLGAYLLYNILDLVKEKDPEAWGLEWCPLAQEDFKKLEELKIGTMNELDWMSRIKKNTFNARDLTGAGGLDKFFFTANGFFGQAGLDHNQARFGYMQEARAYHKLIASAYDRGEGVRVIGHVDPLVTDVNKWFTARATEIWGYTTEGPEIVLKSSDGGGFERTQAKVLDYSPLFVLTSNRVNLFRLFWQENKGRPIKGLPRAFSELQDNIISESNK
jgi:hypothetical protein